MAHWISEGWELEEALIDFVELVGPHTGANMAEAVMGTLKRYELENLVHFGFKLPGCNQ